MPFSFSEVGVSRDWNYGSLNGLCKAMIAFTSSYLFFFDFTVLMANFWQFNEMDSAPKSSLSVIFNLTLHVLVLL